MKQTKTCRTSTPALEALEHLLDAGWRVTLGQEAGPPPLRTVELRLRELVVTGRRPTLLGALRDAVTDAEQALEHALAKTGPR